jgi:hypothetical protein
LKIENKSVFGRFAVEMRELINNVVKCGKKWEKIYYI